MWVPLYGISHLKEYCHPLSFFDPYNSGSWTIMRSAEACAIFIGELVGGWYCKKQKV